MSAIENRKISPEEQRMLFFLFLFHFVFAEKYKLVFVQMIFRHGDRAQVFFIKNDSIQERDWIQTYNLKMGEITQLGATQSLDLGKSIRERYMHQFPDFLSKKLKSEQIHIRSTNNSRTTKSARLFLEGMYPQQKSDQKIHVEVFANRPKDCVGIISCVCNRMLDLLRKSEELDEYRAFFYAPKNQDFIKKASKAIGIELVLRNSWIPVDALRCQRKYFMDRLRRENRWYSEEMYHGLLKLYYKANDFYFGHFENPRGTVVDGINISKEMLKMRLSPGNDEILRRLKKRLECLKTKSCKDRLLFHAYSAHDMMIYALLTTFGIKDYTGLEKGHLPDFSSSIYIELYLDTKENPFFKVLFRNSEKAKFMDLTSKIRGCKGKAYCPLEIFEKLRDYYNLNEPIMDYCEKRLWI